ncbi:Putative ribonuclease H protein At1g65750 [Linum perenne]
MDSKLSGWKCRSLSLAGRVTLAQSVLAAIPAYAMQTSLLPVDTCKEIDKRIRNFVWGSSDEGKKIHLINWDRICTPKESGGLGLRQARYLNLAYMTKLAFLCFQKPDLLWVRVLQGKYFKVSADGLVPAHRSSQSNTWKGICQAWPTMMYGARAGIRDGRLTSFWSTRWLDSGIVLADWANPSDPDFNSSDCVADFVEGDTGWNIDKLNRVLPSEIVEQVMGRSALRDDLGPDSWVWGDAHDGRFKINSAYRMLHNQDSYRENGLFSKIWKWDGPYRIKLFLWLALHERLMTNVERVRRHLVDSSICPRCGARAETVCHVLRDCPIAIGVWRELGFDTTRSSWRGSVADWFSNVLWGDRGTLFGVALWMIWKSRNESIFTDSNPTPPQIAQRSLRWYEAVSEAFERDARCFGDRGLKHWEFVAWEPGPVDMVIINTDGSYSPGRNRAAAGGIIRNYEGRGLVAFTMNLGHCSITRAEIRGAITGLELAWDYGFRNVELQLDSQAAISLLSSSAVPDHQQAAEVIHFQNLCRRDWRISIRHVFREANKAADFLASQGYEFPFGTHLFPLSNCNLGHILRYDCLGVSEPRLIPVVI